MPHLWAYLQIGTSRSNSIHLLYARRLQLARALPITIDIHADRELTPEELSLIQSYSNRIAKLIINPFGYIYLSCSLINQFRQIVFTNLVQFDYTIDSAPESHIRITRDNLSAPFMLPVVQHHRIQWGSWPFGNITSLTLQFLYPSPRPRYTELREILTQCQSTLQYLNLEDRGPKMDVDGRMAWSRITFPRLRSLYIGYVENEQLFLDYNIQAPNLKFLTIRNLFVCPPSAVAASSFTDITAPPGAFVELLLTSFMPQPDLDPPIPGVTRLKQLALIGETMDCGYQMFRTFLANNPRLEDLTLYFPRYAPIFHYYNAFFESNEQDQSALPRLSRLMLSNSVLMLDYLRRRPAKSKPLDEVVLTTMAYHQLLEKVLEAKLEGEDIVKTLVSHITNLLVIEDPIEKSHVSMEPYMEVITDGVWRRV
ncbi:hypothetical protein Moror_12756 [Moniliophthora roreri MCA 2997]|nr:hypothetical protein Moror_12756 [Moniliophthora roreri MCA 2997]